MFMLPLPLWAVVAVCVTTPFPSAFTLPLYVLKTAFPMFFCDMRPLGVGRLLTPGSSPIVRGTSESSTTTPLLLISTFFVALSVSLSIAVLGNGVGMPPGPAGGGGAGMWHVSGVASASPPALVAAGRAIRVSVLRTRALASSSSSAEQDLLAVDRGVVRRDDHGAPRVRREHVLHDRPEAPGARLREIRGVAEGVARLLDQALRRQLVFHDLLGERLRSDGDRAREHGGA